MSVFRSTKGDAASQISVAKTLAPAFVLMPLPPAKSRPLPSTLMCPSVLTSALRSAIAQSWPAGLTPRTTFLVTLGKLPSAFAAPETFETGWTPIPPSNLTREFPESLESFATRATGRRTTTRVASTMAFFMSGPPTSG